MADARGTGTGAVSTRNVKGRTKFTGKLRFSLSPLLLFSIGQWLSLSEPGPR
jgi:hypothetical protein